MDTLRHLPASFSELFDVSDSIKVVEVAKKYEPKDGSPIRNVPEYTLPNGSHSYELTNVDDSWTQGFFPGLIWLLLERQRLLPEAIHPSYSSDELIRLARRYQNGWNDCVRPAQNHDQGFRFQLAHGKDFELTSENEAKELIIEAAESLLDRYNDKIGLIRSWDGMRRVSRPDEWRRDNQDEHYLVIIDNMMNLDLLYQATELTGDDKYATVATRQAEKMATSHIRDDFTTYHVVDFNQDGTIKEQMTMQGYGDDSCWSRGQAWGIYGYAQCALRTGRKDFTDTAKKLADKFLELLPASGVPWWDFDAPQPCPYDASAGTVAACGLLMLYRLLDDETYLARSFKLIGDILRECKTGKATLGPANAVDLGDEQWETILQHSTIVGNKDALYTLMDHGLVYADFYLIQYGNEVLKLSRL